MILKIKQLYISLPFLLVLLGSCSSKPNQSAYFDAYQQSLKDTTPVAVNNNTVADFSRIFANIQSDKLASLVEELYADRFYFNDTFRTIRHKQTLINYLTETGINVDALEVEIQDIARSDNEVYVRWTMYMAFTVMGKMVESNSIGITHLRFNDDGKIILHQDYWDGADAFYQHLPIIGLGLRHVRSKL